MLQKIYKIITEKMKLANETLLNLINIAEDIIKRGRKVLLNLQEFANNIIPKPKSQYLKQKMHRVPPLISTDLFPFISVYI